MDAISVSGHRLELIEEILSWAEIEPDVISGLIQLSSEYPTRSKSLVAALTYGRYHKALNELRTLVKEDHQEKVYQEFLEENFWIFGSEYSKLLPKRNLAQGIQLDFPLRRTVDGYLEVIEIKRPLNNEKLFREDKSHTNMMTRIPKLTDAIDQVANYLQQWRVFL